MRKSRIHIPLTEETRENLQRYADAAGVTLSKACSQVLEQTAPVMGELAVAFEEAKTAPAKAIRTVHETMEKKLAEMDQIKMDLSPKATRKKAS